MHKIAELLSPLRRAKTFASGRAIRELPRLRRIYGPGRWRKRKGFATARLQDGRIVFAEVHWYEAHGVGRKEFKVKRVIYESEEPQEGRQRLRDLYRE